MADEPTGDAGKRTKVKLCEPKIAFRSESFGLATVPLLILFNQHVVYLRNTLKLIFTFYFTTCYQHYTLAQSSAMLHARVY